MMLYVIAYRLNPDSSILYEIFDKEDKAKTVGGCISETYGIPVKLLSINVGDLGL